MASQVKEYKKKLLSDLWDYEYTYYKRFDYKILRNAMTIKSRKKGNYILNDAIIMFDTETSKDHIAKQIYNEKKDRMEYETQNNHICYWILSIRICDINICTLYGRSPREAVECIDRVHNAMVGEKTLFFVHYLNYDWTFMRKFFFEKFGFPVEQLNVKPHKPLSIEFANGIILRDSYILAARKLEKWAEDMDVEHKKLSGTWDYDKIRNQKGTLITKKEMKYAENDGLAGIECIAKTCEILDCNLDTMPMTNTGIVRNHIRRAGIKNHAKNYFNKVALDFNQYIFLEKIFHGGYTHAYREIIEKIINNVTAYDFTSSYPYCMIAMKYPSEAFSEYKNTSINEIVEYAYDYAFAFKLILYRPCIKKEVRMPFIQVSKCTKVINPIFDNGRIVAAEYLETLITEMDLLTIAEQYNYEREICVDVIKSKKDYLPRWFRDEVYTLFGDKCKLKGVDEVLYNIKKFMLNSCYGMCVQKSIRNDIEEDYETGEVNETVPENPEENYNKYLKNRNNILPYQWGVWTTANATYNLFQLGKLCDWIYSDTDSAYGINWNLDGVEEYNNKVKKNLTEQGYGAVVIGKKEFWLGVAELDGKYSGFVTCGAKRYACEKEDGEIKITVAGVPKKAGKECLESLNNFKEGFIFKGEKTGKFTFTYKYVDKIYQDKNGNLIGDSMDQTPCDYLLSKTVCASWEDIETEYIYDYIL